MAATDSQAMQIAQQACFQGRVNVALMKSAVAVMTEANTVTGHALRVTYAKTVLAGVAAMLPVALAVMVNATIQAEANIVLPTDGAYGVPDSDIEFQTNSIFSALSGVAN